MKKLVSLMILALFVLQLSAQNVTFYSKTPEAGNSFSFIYDPKGGALDKQDNVKCIVHTFINFKRKAITIPLTKEGTVFKGDFIPADSTAFALFTFSSEGIQDTNPSGYYTLFYKNGNPTAIALYWDAQFYNGMGSSLAGVEKNRPKALISFEKAFNIDPKLKATVGAPYFALQYGMDREKGEKLIMSEIASINAVPNGKELELARVAELYKLLNKKASSDSVYVLIKAKFPKGTYAYNDAYTMLANETDMAKKEAGFDSIIKKFNLNPTKNSDAEKLMKLYQMIAIGYGQAKNNSKFEEYANKINNKLIRASTYNTYAKTSADKKENLEFASVISKKSIDLIESAKNDPTPESYASEDEYLRNLQGSHIIYANTYSLLLEHLGKSIEALKFLEYAVTKNNFINTEMNSRYVSLLAKTGQTDKMISYAERFTKEGRGSEQMKIELKTAYKGSQPFDTYYALLERDMLEKEKVQFMKEMINIPAPKFTLSNLKGETVSLEKLKGKVVVLDYWATWCVPCIASFPGMQKAVDKYKNDPDVVFLFINTLQKEENREQVVKDWMTANPQFSFNVLLDTRNAKDPSKFDVIKQYKADFIPAKYIIDGNGNIRFKKEGFDTTVDGIVKEMDIMIALAKENKEMGK